MNLLVVNYEYPPLGGGGGVACEQVAVELAAMGHRVDVVTSLGPGTEPAEMRDGVHITRAKVWCRRGRQTASLPSMLTFVLSAIRAGKRLIGERRYDIVHVHFAVPSGPAGIRIGRAAKCPVVLSVHGGDLYDPSKRLSPHRCRPVGAVVRHVMRSADLVLAQSSNTAENARRYHRFKGRIEIVPLGIPPHRFEAVSRERFGLGEDEFVAVTIGRIVRRKGLSYLLDALAGAEIEGLKLMVVGDGPERANLARQAQALGLGDVVQFIGQASDEEKFQLLSVADLFVMASLHEGFGIIFLEAMSEGLPMVATNVGGQTDFLTDEVNALLVPPEDSAALRDAVRRAAGDDGLRARMKENNLRDVKRFEIRRIAERHVELFEELIR